MANTEVWNEMAKTTSSQSTSLPFISYHLTTPPPPPHQLVKTQKHYQQLFLQSNSANNVTNNSNSSFVNLQIPLQSSSNTVSSSQSYPQYSDTFNGQHNNNNFSEEVTSRLNQKSNNCKVFTPLCHVIHNNTVGQRYSRNYNRHPSFPKRKNKYHKNNTSTVNNKYLVEHKRVHQLTGPQAHQHNITTTSPTSGYYMSSPSQANDYQYQDQQQYQNSTMLGIRKFGNNDKIFQQQQSEANFCQQQLNMPFIQNQSYQPQYLQSYSQFQQQPQQQQQQSQSQSQLPQLKSQALQFQNQQQYQYIQQKQSDQSSQNYPQPAYYTQQSNFIQKPSYNKINTTNQMNIQRKTQQTQFTNKREQKRKQPEQKQYQVEMTLPDSLKNQEPVQQTFYDKRKKTQTYNHGSNFCQFELPQKNDITKTQQKQETNEKFKAQVNGFVRKSKYNKPLSAFMRSFDVSRGNRYIPVLPRYLRKDWV